ncbi:PQQ-binding-like beta-propeller repeat protein [Actinomadura sp. 1N219]|uniref:outer membrane protein assembly factor BamB family protein n=1 Tax=Actinomadura sp. 1N219 TaxID=3375152 RepID=UPI0037AE1A3E
MEPLHADDPAGFGPYQLLARLGSGGMGRVYLGRSPSGRTVAVKVVHAELAKEPDFRARFRREVAAASAVSGAFTAPVVDADPDAPSPWLVTAFLPGLSLQAAVERHGPLPPHAVAALGMSLADGLAAVHRAGVVHRDLKPSNVLITPDGPRVIDFGIARAAEGGAVTQSGMVVGSPGFMPPEQAGGHESGPPGDVYSLGAVLTFAATGSGPFGEAPMHAMVYRVLHENPDLGRVPEPRLRAVIGACLNRDQAERPALPTLMHWLSQLVPEDTSPQSTGWLPAPVAAEITSLTRQVPQGPVRMTGTVPAAAAQARPVGRRRALAVGLSLAGAAGLAAAGGGAGWWLLNRDDYRWTWETEWGDVIDGPAVMGGVAVLDQEWDNENTVYGLDADTGEERWKRKLDGRVIGFAGVQDGAVFLYSGVRQLIVLNAADGKETLRLPITEAGGGVVTGGGLIFMRRGDPETGKDGLAAISLATGALRWHVPIGDAVSSPPVYANGALYFTADRSLIAVDAATGKPRWTSPGETKLIGTPAVAGDTVYVSSEAGLNAMSTTDGKPRWAFPNTAPKGVSYGWIPTIADRLVFIPSSGGDLNAIDIAGPGPRARPRWTFPTGGDVELGPTKERLLSPVIHGGVACVFNGRDRLSGVDVATGRRLWEHRAAAFQDELPVIAKGGVHLATKDDGILSVEPKSGKVLGRIEGLKTSRLSAVGDRLYFAAGPVDRTKPDRASALDPPTP